MRVDAGSQSDTNLLPIWYQSGINLVRIWYQLGINVIPIWYESGTNVVHMCNQSGTNLVRIWYQSDTNLVPIWYTFGINLVPIWYQCCTHVLPIWYQSNTNLVSIWYESGIYESGTNLIRMSEYEWNINQILSRMDLLLKGATPPALALDTATAELFGTRSIGGDERILRHAGEFDVICEKHRDCEFDARAVLV